VPSAPSQPRITDITADSCLVSWSAPSSDGGAPITGYHVERRRPNASGWSRLTALPTTDTRYAARDLLPGTAYEFRVLAENRAGLSPAGTASGPVLARDPWDKPACPTNPKITEVTKRSCKLSWRPPTTDGGDEVACHWCHVYFILFLSQIQCVN
jgi:titin